MLLCVNVYCQLFEFNSNFFFKFENCCCGKMSQSNMARTKQSVRAENVELKKEIAALRQQQQLQREQTISSSVSSQSQLANDNENNNNGNVDETNNGNCNETNNHNKTNDMDILAMVNSQSDDDDNNGSLASDDDNLTIAEQMNQIKPKTKNTRRQKKHKHRKKHKRNKEKSTSHGNSVDATIPQASNNNNIYNNAEITSVPRRKQQGLGSRHKHGRDSFYTMTSNTINEITSDYPWMIPMINSEISSMGHLYDDKRLDEYKGDLQMRMLDRSVDLINDYKQVIQQSMSKDELLQYMQTAQAHHLNIILNRDVPSIFNHANNNDGTESRAIEHLARVSNQNNMILQVKMYQDRQHHAERIHEYKKQQLILERTAEAQGVDMEKLQSDLKKLDDEFKLEPVMAQQIFPQLKPDHLPVIEGVNQRIVNAGNLPQVDIDKDIIHGTTDTMRSPSGKKGLLDLCQALQMRSGNRKHFSDVIAKVYAIGRAFYNDSTLTEMNTTLFDCIPKSKNDKLTLAMINEFKNIINLDSNVDNCILLNELVANTQKTVTL